MREGERERVHIWEKNVNWHGTMKSAEVKVVKAPASTVTPIVVAACETLPSRVLSSECMYACERCSV